MAAVEDYLRAILGEIPDPNIDDEQLGVNALLLKQILEKGVVNIDIRVNGVSILKNGVAEMPKASTNDYGIVKLGSSYYGLGLSNDGLLRTIAAYDSDIDTRNAATRPITAQNYDYAVKSAMSAPIAEKAGMIDGAYHYPAWTDAEKAAARERLGIPELIRDAMNEVKEIAREQAILVRQIDIDKEYMENGDFTDIESEWPYLPVGYNVDYNGGDGYSPVKTEDGKLVFYSESWGTARAEKIISNLPSGRYKLAISIRALSGTTDVAPLITLCPLDAVDWWNYVSESPKVTSYRLENLEYEVNIPETCDAKFSITYAFAEKGFEIYKISLKQVLA